MKEKKGLCLAALCASSWDCACIPLRPGWNPHGATKPAAQLVVRGIFGFAGLSECACRSACCSPRPACKTRVLPTPFPGAPGPLLRPGLNLIAGVPLLGVLPGSYGLVWGSRGRVCMGVA